jgi:hypothetical protein
LNRFDRVAMVDVQPHYFSGAIDRVDLVIDHHPEQTGYTAVYKDIRPDCGSTSTILTEHLRAADADVSEPSAISGFARLASSDWPPSSRDRNILPGERAVCPSTRTWPAKDATTVPMVPRLGEPLANFWDFLRTSSRRPSQNGGARLRSLRGARSQR